MPDTPLLGVTLQAVQDEVNRGRRFGHAVRPRDDEILETIEALWASPVAPLYGEDLSAELDTNRRRREPGRTSRASCYGSSTPRLGENPWESLSTWPSCSRSPSSGNRPSPSSRWRPRPGARSSSGRSWCR